MKKVQTMLYLTLFFMLTGRVVNAQFVVKGPDSTSANQSLIIKNGKNDTSMVVRGDNRVGIGTVNPQRTLHVKGVIYGDSGVQFPDGTIQLTGFTGTVNYGKSFVVAASGGNFTTITAALNACVAPSATNQYLVTVMPGVYTESIRCKRHVHLRGAGKYASVIQGTVWGADSSMVEGFRITKGFFCNGTSPTILLNIISNSRSDTADGIFINANGRPWIKENEVEKCSKWGIRCVGVGADPWIIANRIMKNDSGGIRCENASPAISNNFLDSNNLYGIYLVGGDDMPSEPTIDDNVIGHTDFNSIGIGIFMRGRAEPRIMSNDIYLNDCGIWIDPATQPSIIGNNINYNRRAGIRCFSQGSSKRVVITGNHIHSNCRAGSAPQQAGIWVQNANPLISFNQITQNDNSSTPIQPDIDFSACLPAPPTNLPTISSNVIGILNRGSLPMGLVGGSFNTDLNGIQINP